MNPCNPPYPAGDLRRHGPLQSKGERQLGPPLLRSPLSVR